MPENKDPQQPRAFKGVWIPAILWDAEDLTPWQKMLVAEIDALDSGEGCWARNEHLATRMGSSAPSIANSLTELRQKGWVETISRPDERRRLRVKYSEWHKLHQPVKNNQLVKGDSPAGEGDSPAGEATILRGTSKGTSEGGSAQAPTPTGEKKGKGKTVALVTEEGHAFADWFRTLLPETLDAGKLPSGWRARWARVYDELRRLDQKTDAEIRAVCEWARKDSFWASNFFTPAKLRERGRGSELRFIDLWQQQAAQGTRPQTPAATKAALDAKTYPVAVADRPKAFDPLAELEQESAAEPEAETAHDDHAPTHEDNPFPI